MIFLESVRTRITLAVKLKDEYTVGQDVLGEVSLKVSEIPETHVKPRHGYFLLLDVPPGKYSIVAGGTFYREGTFLLDLGSLSSTLSAGPKPSGPKLPLAEFTLEPKANYPFPEGMTVLKGRVVNLEGRPLSGASITLKDMTEGAVTEENGDFFLYFKAATEDKHVTLKIEKDGYETWEKAILLKKGMTTRLGRIEIIVR